jgi:hypothetical protein
MSTLHVEAPIDAITLESLGYHAIEGWAFHGKTTTHDAREFFLHWGSRDVEYAAARSVIAQRLASSHVACDALLALWAGWDPPCGGEDSNAHMLALTDLVERAARGEL